jgi:hypothetical protein
MWFVNLVKKYFPSRFSLARLTKMPGDRADKRAHAEVRQTELREAPRVELERAGLSPQCDSGSMNSTLQVPGSPMVHATGQKLPKRRAYHERWTVRSRR